RMSMPPKASTVAATAARTWSSSRMSHFSARPRPPAASTASAALWMVPGSFGLGTADLAAMATLAPSRAARRAMARPMPREAPVMNRVLPARLVMRVSRWCRNGIVARAWPRVGGRAALPRLVLRLLRLLRAAAGTGGAQPQRGQARDRMRLDPVRQVGHRLAHLLQRRIGVRTRPPGGQYVEYRGTEVQGLGGADPQRFVSRAQLHRRRPQAQRQAAVGILALAHHQQGLGTRVQRGRQHRDPGRPCIL